MKRLTVLISITALLVIIGMAVYLQSNRKGVLAGVEAYQIGTETILLNGAGNTTVGDYPDPVPEGPGVREIVMGYTCMGTEVFFNEIFPAFARYWEEKTGEKVRFTTGWNAIGVDSVATTVYGKPIQVMTLAAQNNGLSRGFSHTKWKNSRNKGIVYYYPYVFVVRKGNPLNIRTYADLLRPDVQVVHADPMGTHGGISAVFSLYGSVLKETEAASGRRDPFAADEFLKQVEEKAIIKFGGRAASVAFSQGVGDVLLVIEPKARALVAKNPSCEIVVPPNTLLTEIIAYKMEKNISKKDRELIDAFIDFLFSEESQEAFARGGYRPSDPDVMARHPEFDPAPGAFGQDYLGEATQTKKDLILDKWMGIYNSTKPEHERLKLKKLPLDQLPDESEWPVQQALPEE